MLLKLVLVVHLVRKMIRLSTTCKLKWGVSTAREVFAFQDLSVQGHSGYKIIDEILLYLNDDQGISDLH